LGFGDFVALPNQSTTNKIMLSSQLNYYLQYGDTLYYTIEIIPWKMVKAERERKPKADIVTRDYTIHMSKRLFGVTFKNRAPRAIREIKQFASKAMKTS
jgi:hypothetical protein